MGASSLVDVEFILICSALSLFHTIPQTLNPVTDTLDFSYFTYNTQTNCQANNYMNGVLEATYQPFNVCYTSDTPGDGDSAFTSCSSAGLVMTTYASTDGSCGGGVTDTMTYTPAMGCTDATSYITDFAYGWFNFACVGVSSFN
jgi:hypothetical protein